MSFGADTGGSRALRRVGGGEARGAQQRAPGRSEEQTLLSLPSHSSSPKDPWLGPRISTLSQWELKYRIQFIAHEPSLENGAFIFVWKTLI